MNSRKNRARTGGWNKIGLIGQIGLLDWLGLELESIGLLGLIGLIGPIGDAFRVA